MQAVLVSVSLLVLIVNSHPICTSGGSENASVMDQFCTDNITADKMFLDKWLDFSDNSKGIDQLRRRSRNSVASIILTLQSQNPIKFHDCLEDYVNMTSCNSSSCYNDTSITTIRHFFNAYLMHKLYVKHLVGLGEVKLLVRDWLQPPTAVDTYTNLTKLLNILNYNIKNLGQLLNTTCHGCTRNCSKSIEMVASLISKMSHCSSPIRSVVFTITSHSEKLYKVVKRLKHVVDDQSSSNKEMNNPLTEDVDSLCWCN